jgi:hypothetical protein
MVIERSKSYTKTNSFNSLLSLTFITKPETKKTQINVTIYVNEQQSNLQTSLKNSKKSIKPPRIIDTTFWKPIHQLKPTCSVETIRDNFWWQKRINMRPKFVFQNWSKQTLITIPIRHTYHGDWTFQIQNQSKKQSFKFF